MFAAQALAIMKVALQSLCGLHAEDTAPGGSSSCRAARERELRACEEELRRREEQVQLAMADASRKEEALVAQV